MAYNTFGPGIALDKVTMRGLPAQPARIIDAATGDTVQAFTMGEDPTPIVLSTNTWGYFPQFQTIDVHEQIQITFGRLELTQIAWEIIQRASNAEARVGNLIVKYNADVAAQNLKLNNVSDRLQSVEVLGGLAPGDVSDATVKSLIINPGSQTGTALNAAIGETVGEAQALPPVNKFPPAWAKTRMLYQPEDSGWDLVTGVSGTPATDGTSIGLDSRPGPFTSQSLKMTRVSQQVSLQKNGTTIDLSQGPLIVWFYSPLPVPHGVEVRAYTSPGNYFSMLNYGARPALDPHSPGTSGWQVAELYAIRSVGSPTIKNITSLHIQPTTSNSELWIGAVGIRDNATPFYNGVLTLYFDDGYTSQHDLAGPALAAHGVSGVLGCISEYMDNSPNFMRPEQARELQNKYGWEVAGHAYSGSTDTARFTSLSESQLELEFSNLKLWLRKNGFTSDVWVSPGGQASKQVWDIGRKYFAVHRGVASAGEAGIRQATEDNSPFLARPENILTPNWSSTTSTVDGMKALISRIKVSKAWGSIGFHQIVEDNVVPGAFGIRVSDLSAIVAYAKEIGVPIRTVKQVLEEVKNPSALTPVSAEYPFVQTITEGSLTLEGASERVVGTTQASSSERRLYIMDLGTAAIDLGGTVGSISVSVINKNNGERIFHTLHFSQRGAIAAPGVHIYSVLLPASTQVEVVVKNSHGTIPIKAAPYFIFAWGRA